MSVTCWAPVERAGDAAAAMSAASATSAAMPPLIAPIVDDASEKIRSEQPTPYEALADAAHPPYSPDPAGRGARVGRSPVERLRRVQARLGRSAGWTKVPPRRRDFFGPIQRSRNGCARHEAHCQYHAGGRFGAAAGLGPLCRW